ncbi:Hypothetical predicted protein [Pelobates cultripes]|uniref:Uncharacterized protein n=1 Tax=Pelobates cultripes TaxID=61616 RepID=A0AAD1W7T3_PELCU|nr:Hypothetical predicted protein [Pelobates cultripes]
MANGGVTYSDQQTPSDWAADFNARFEAACNRFWTRLEQKHRPIPPTLVHAGPSIHRE